jgi:putative membrane protein
VSAFFIHWAITALSLWAASKVFAGLAFEDASALWVAALLLGFANAAVRPVLILLTFPLTLLSLGLFMLVINAMMIMLVSALVRGFKVSNFSTAFFASIFISLLGMFLSAMLNPGPGQVEIIRLPSMGTWI